MFVWRNKGLKYDKTADLMLKLLFEVRHIRFPFRGSSGSTFTERSVSKTRFRNTMHIGSRCASYIAYDSHFVESMILLRSRENK
jgi:hypothetical protein